MIGSERRQKLEEIDALRARLHQCIKAPLDLPFDDLLDDLSRAVRADEREVLGGEIAERIQEAVDDADDPVYITGLTTAHNLVLARNRSPEPPVPFEPTSGLWHLRLSPDELQPGVTITPMPSQLTVGRLSRTLRPTKWHQEEVRGRHFLVVDEAVDEESGNALVAKEGTA